VTYRSDKSEGPTAGTETADPLEFLAQVLVRIPDKGHVTTRYGGGYATRARSIRRAAQPPIDPGPREPGRLTRAALVRRRPIYGRGGCRTQRHRSRQLWDIGITCMHSEGLRPESACPHRDGAAPGHTRTKRRRHLTRRVDLDGQHLVGTDHGVEIGE